MQDQTSREREGIDRSTKITVGDGLSNECKRQREGIDSIGAFGNRTGESDLVFLQGILPEINGDVMSDYSIEEQTNAVLDRLELMLANRNVGLENLMKVEIQLTEPEAAEAVDEIYESRFDGVEFPPRTVVGVCLLPDGAAIQLDVIAAKE
jgi:2-iminobutanoate/2-iminopropanoate deaminase